jgi:hypothetical protein
MKIKEKTLLIHKAIGDDAVPALQKAITSSKVEKIIITTKDLSATVLQLLLCAHKIKPVEIKIDDAVLKSFFANVKYS